MAKTPAHKRKPAAKVVKRTMIAETMTPQPETIPDAEVTAVVVRHHWWERTLYAIARIWS